MGDLADQERVRERDDRLDDLDERERHLVAEACSVDVAAPGEPAVDLERDEDVSDRPQRHAPVRSGGTDRRSK